MSNTFLFRLFKKSKVFFIFSIFFILGYIIILNKKMDMLIFPINNMFSETNNPVLTSSTYAFKINGKLINITSDFYLKKDFSENSLMSFSNWIKNDGNNFISHFLKLKITDSLKRISFLEKLSPKKSTKFTWPVWFAKFHHIAISPSDTIELWEYKFAFNNKKFAVTDSTLLLKETSIYE